MRPAAGARSLLAALVAAITGLAGVASAQQPIVTTVLNNGPNAHRYDLVILADGYQAQERPRFDQDVNAFLTGLFAKPPYSTFGSYFNVHTVFRASVDSGASHPDVSPPIVRNTAYGASYNTGGTARCLYIANTSLANQDAALAPANESRVLVLVNDSRYGGCAGQFAVSYNGTDMVEVQSHEFGHALGGLADEYDYPNGTYTGSEPNRSNITAEPTGQKWSHWWGTEGVSAFEGAGYYLRGLYRPKSNCLMRSLYRAHCPVCREQLVRQLNSVVDVIETTTPAAASLVLSVPQSQAFAFTDIVPAGNNKVVTWSVDGQVQLGQTGSSFVFDSAAHPAGVRLLKVEVEDRTGLVRADPAATMVDSHTWTITVADPNAVDLRVTSALMAPQTVQAGQQVDLSATVHNDGPGTATDVVVEHFLSVDGTLEPTDLYLGRTVVPSLPPGALPLQRRVTLPGLLPVPFYVLIAVVDREGAVAEIHEGNNTSFAVAFTAPPACVDRLEFRDDLLYPRDHAELALASGGTVLPTVISPCRTGGGVVYLIAWGCSGTQPGTPLAPNVTVPLNHDPCTDLALGAINGPIFTDFWGVLDAAGVGRATLNWPANAAVAGFQSWLAGVLLDTGTGAIVAATNPVELTFTP